MSIGNLTTLSAIEWCERLIAVAVILQTLELLFLRKTFADRGVWRWATIQPEFDIFSRPVRIALAGLLPYRPFLGLLLVRLFVAAYVVYSSAAHPFSLVFLLISTILIALRWRGTFNGGSDYMTVVVLSALSVAALFSESRTAQDACLWYITLQLCGSYFIAGAAKLKQPEWRSGTALTRYLRSPLYQAPDSLKRLFANQRFAFLGAWTITVFECAFPLALAGSEICATFIAAALSFHLTNVYAFGLNRFFFAWAAAYPALLWASNS